MIMRVFAVGCACMALITGSAMGQAAHDPVLTDEEYASLIALLDEAHDTLIGLVSGMTDEQWNFRENPDRWSTGECVEHIARSEQAMLATIKELTAGERDPDWYEKTDGTLAVLKELVPNPRPQGQGGVRAPGELQPTEKWDRKHGIEQFYAVQGEVRSFVETMDREIKNRTMESNVPQFGWMNAHDWLHLLAYHVLRHSKQIEKIHADPNYPDAPSTAAAEEPDPNVTDDEFATLVKAIDDAQDTLLGLITGLSDEQWTFRENPDRWSIGECVEHIARTEGAILNGIALLLRGPANPNWHDATDGKIELVRQIAVSRNPGGAGSTFRAPGEVAPSENWDRARGFQQFYTAHGELRAFVETMDREVKNRTMENPFPELGTLNGYDWLTLAALHIVRHSQQIAEVKADPNFPE